MLNMVLSCKVKVRLLVVEFGCVFLFVLLGIGIGIVRIMNKFFDFCFVVVKRVGEEEDIGNVVLWYKIMLLIL